MSTVLNGALRLFVSSHHLALQPILWPSSLLKEFSLIAYPTITESVTPEALQLNPSISTKFKKKIPKKLQDLSFILSPEIEKFTAKVIA